MPLPDLLIQSRRYVRSLRWFIRGCDDEDLVGIFVLAGLEAVLRGGSWRLFKLAGCRKLMSLMRAQQRMCRSGIDVPLDEARPRSKDRYAESDARLTVEGLMDSAGLTELETRAIVRFLSGERSLYYGSEDGSEGKRLSNAAQKALKKLRASAKKGKIHAALD